MLAGVEARLGDLDVVLKETHDHRFGFLTDKTNHLKKWMIEVRKMKATYHCLNMFNFDVSEKAMVAECWMPQFDIPEIKEVLNKAAEDCGSTIAPILNEISVDEMPPTYNRVNKYTAGFQLLVGMVWVHIETGAKKMMLAQKKANNENPQFLSNQADILSTHESVICTKFHKDWIKIMKSYFWASNIFYIFH